MFQNKAIIFGDLTENPFLLEAKASLELLLMLHRFSCLKPDQ